MVPIMLYYVMILLCFDEWNVICLYDIWYMFYWGYMIQYHVLLHPRWNKYKEAIKEGKVFAKVLGGLK